MEGYPTPAPRREPEPAKSAAHPPAAVGPPPGRLSFEPMAILDEPLRGVVGGKAAARAEKAFGLRTAGDLLRHYPRR